MPVPVAEVKKPQIHTLPSYLTQFPKKKLDDEPPAYSMKHRVIGFLATHKEEAFELEELYQKIFPPGNAEFAQRSDFYRKWLCELFDEGNILAGKKRRANLLLLRIPIRGIRERYSVSHQTKLYSPNRQTLT
jgi:hypothetical protein